jgi:bacillaene synthase trans-acting acyltransferase
MVSEARTVFMFSGQGSQYYQMGRELFDQHEVFRDWMIRLDTLARDISGQGILEVIYSRSKSAVFSRTTFTHPAIFMVEYSLARCLMQAGVLPDLVLGASLGSFAAATVAGYIEVEDAMTAVIRQAAAFESWCEPGGMIAVLADRALFAESFLSRHSELAATHFASHFAVSARQAALEELEAGLRTRDITHQRLAASFPFHSRWIERAQIPFQSSIETIRYRAGRLPLVCCERATTLSRLPADFLWSVVRQPIRFHETIRQLELAGSHRYIDLGPSGTLATFVKYGLPSSSRSTAHAVLTPYGQDHRNLAALIH